MGASRVRRPRGLSPVGACPLIPLDGLSSSSQVAGVLDPLLTRLRQVTTGSGNDAVEMG